LPRKNTLAYFAMGEEKMFINVDAWKWYSETTAGPSGVDPSVSFINIFFIITDTCSHLSGVCTMAKIALS
jgi:hypothetical protein